LGAAEFFGYKDMPNSPVLERHKHDGATLVESQGWLLPSRYSSVADEYQALNQGVGVLDRSHVGRLNITGKDSIDLLNRLSTNELATLEVNKGVPTVLTSNKGRILDLLVVLRLEDRLMVQTGPENRQRVVDWIDLYTFTEDVRVQDVTEDTAMLSLAGPHAAGLLDHLTGNRISSLALYEVAAATIGSMEVSIVRTDFARIPGYDMVVPAADGQSLWAELLAGGEEAGARPVGVEALEITRVEQGVPAHGKELSEELNPLEADLLKFISFTKGCYVGQEVIARLNTYKKVQKHLVALQWDSDGPPDEGAKLLLDGTQVGFVTSAVRSPKTSRAIGLGYVRRAHAEPGTVLTVESAGGQAATQVVALPQ
jgi:folate-binding protein YgfZ